jgi:hypothetical protein
MVGAARTTIRAGRVGLCLAHTGRMDEARAKLQETIEAFGISAEEDEMSGTILADLLCTAVLLEDRKAATLLAGRLQDVTAIGYGEVSITNVARALGRAALLAGNPGEARQCYQRSLEWATAIRHRPEIALTRLELAELLLDQAVSYQQSAVSPRRTASGGEEKLMAEKLKAEGLAHLDFVIQDFRAMKMQPSLERAEDLRAQLTARR